MRQTAWYTGHLTIKNDHQWLHETCRPNWHHCSQFDVTAHQIEFWISMELWMELPSDSKFNQKLVLIESTSIENEFERLLSTLFYSFVIHEISIFTLAKFIRLQMKMERKRKSRINLIFSGFQIYYCFFHMLLCLLNYIPMMNTNGVFFCCHLYWLGFHWLFIIFSLFHCLFNFFYILNCDSLQCGSNVLFYRVLMKFLRILQKHTEIWNEFNKLPSSIGKNVVRNSYKLTSTIHRNQHQWLFHRSRSIRRSFSSFLLKLLIH